MIPEHVPASKMVQIKHGLRGQPSNDNAKIAATKLCINNIQFANSAKKRAPSELVCSFISETLNSKVHRSDRSGDPVHIWTVLPSPLIVDF